MIAHLLKQIKHCPKEPLCLFGRLAPLHQAQDQSPLVRNPPLAIDDMLARAIYFGLGMLHRAY